MLTSTPVIKTFKHEGTHVVSAGNLYRVIANGHETDNRFSLMEAILEPGQGGPYHTHSREDESFFVLEGQVTFYLEDGELIATRDDFVSCPPGVARGFRNHTNNTARMLLFYSSAGVEEMTIRDGKIVDAGTTAREIATGNDIECPVLAEEYGIENSKRVLPTQPTLLKERSINPTE